MLHKDTGLLAPFDRFPMEETCGFSMEDVNLISLNDQHTVHVYSNTSMFEPGTEARFTFSLNNVAKHGGHLHSLCLGPIGDFCIGDGEMYSYTRDASRCLAILSINTSRLFTEGSVIPPEHRLMLVNFHPECIGDAKKSPVGPRH